MLQFHYIPRGINLDIADYIKLCTSSDSSTSSVLSAGALNDIDLQSANDLSRSEHVMYADVYYSQSRTTIGA